MSRPVVRWPLRPNAANGTERGSSAASPRCLASASRVISDAERLCRRASRASAAARSSGSDTVVRFIRAYYQRGREPELRDRVSRDRDELIVATSRRRRDLVVNARRERCVVRRVVPRKRSEPVTVQRTVSATGRIVVCGQPVALGRVHSGRIVRVHVSEHTLAIELDGETRTVRRTTNRPVVAVKGSRPPRARATSTERSASAALETEHPHRLRA
jgi:hypothetical protein